MTTHKKFEVIIIGGSYSGLSAAMSLGRALRAVLIIDAGKPCNSQTPHSHNFITQDGQTPAHIATTAREQVKQYKTVHFYDGTATNAIKTATGFEVKTASGETFEAKKLILATGLKDIMPDLNGFAACWGISIIHCPYCHGYEVKNEKTGILANGDMAFEMVRLISQWTKELLLFTNGPSTLTREQTAQIEKHNVQIIATEIDSFEHTNGQLRQVVFKDQTKVDVKAVYSRPKSVQQSNIPADLGCEFTEQGLLKVDAFQKTNIPGVYACGDNSSFRSVIIAASTGSFAGAMTNKEITDESF